MSTQRDLHHGCRSTVCNIAYWIDDYCQKSHFAGSKCGFQPVQRAVALPRCWCAPHPSPRHLHRTRTEHACLSCLSWWLPSVESMCRSHRRVQSGVVCWHRTVVSHFGQLVHTMPLFKCIFQHLFHHLMLLLTPMHNVVNGFWFLYAKYVWLTQCAPMCVLTLDAILYPWPWSSPPPPRSHNTTFIFIHIRSPCTRIWRA